MKEFLIDNFRETGLWLFIAYAVVVIAMGVDLATGIRKSLRRGRKLNSRGYKRTCGKAVKYLLPMMCLSCIDLLASVVVSVPVLTMLYGAYCAFCEWKSVMETTHDKAQIERQINAVTGAISQSSDLKQLIINILKSNDDEKNQ